MAYDGFGITPRRLRVCALGCLTLLHASTAKCGEQIAETQGFMDLEARGSLTERWGYFLNHQSKVRDEEPEYFLYHIKGGLRYKAAPWLDFALAQRYEESRERGKDDWGREYRTEFDTTPRLALGSWTLASRNRIEYRDFASPKIDRWRYRNELKVSHPLPFWDLGGYVSEEPQYDFEVNRWSKHRATVGLTRKLNRWLSADVYYRWDIIEQSKDEGEWDNVQIIGVKLVIDIDRLTGA